MSEPFSYEFEFTLNKKDIESYWVYNYKNTPYHKKNLIIARFFMTLFFIFPLFEALINYSSHGHFQVEILDGFCLFVISFNLVWIPFFPLINKMIFKALISEQPMKYGIDITQILKFNNDRIVSWTKINELFFKWNEIEHILNNKDYVCIYPNSKAWIIVPRKQFKSPEEFDEFLRKIKEVHAESKKHGGEVKY